MLAIHEMWHGCNVSLGHQAQRNPRAESDQGDAGDATTWHLHQAKPARGGANYQRQWHMVSLAKGTNKITDIRTRRHASDRHYSERQVGGMLVIVSNKWSKHIKEWWKDPSGYGVVSSVTIQGMSQVITIFGRFREEGVTRQRVRDRSGP